MLTPVDARTRASGRGIPAQLLDQESDLARSVGRWEFDVDAGLPIERAHRRLEVRGDFEAWAIYWPQGGRLEMHDHGGSSGAFWVVSGRLREDFSTSLAGRIRRREVSAGNGIAFGPRYFHDVINDRPEAATSVHVYSPRLTSLTHYRLTPAGLVPATVTSYRLEEIG
jgi:mannose-6-phosphate isomerase-like protein (cupin superfamily)